MRKFLALLIVALAAIISASAIASPVGGSDSTHGVNPGVFDPGNTGCPTAEWTSEGLDLHKLCDSSTNAAAGADVVGFQGQVLTQLSFDIKNGSHVGAGSPRFDVVFSNGDFFIFSAHYAPVQTDLENGWTHYEFDAFTPYCDFASAQPEGCGFGSEIEAMDVLLDEEGVAILRNISVNGLVMNSAQVSAAAKAQVNRDGYCSQAPVKRADGTTGRFVDLEFGQASVDSRWFGSTPAYFVQGLGESCEVPAGYSLVPGVTVNSAGEAGGNHPYAKKG